MTSYTIVPGQAASFPALAFTFKIAGTGFTSECREDLLKYYFLKTIASWINESTPHTAPTHFYLSMHDGDPGETPGLQTTNEISMTSYARVAIIRTTAGWTVADAGSGDWGAKNAATVAFPANGAGTNYVVNDLWFGIGTDATGGGELLFRGAYGATTTNCMTDQSETDVLLLTHGGGHPSWNSLNNGVMSGVRDPIYIGLYTLAYAHGHTQLNNEIDVASAPATYINYRRFDTGNWGSLVVPDGAGVFNQSDIQLYSAAISCGASTVTPQFWRAGTAATGAGRPLFHGTISNPPVIVNGSTPTIFAGNAQIAMK